jgi:hypothetical protein
MLVAIVLTLISFTDATLPVHSEWANFTFNHHFHDLRSAVRLPERQRSLTSIAALQACVSPYLAMALRFAQPPSYKS